MLCLVPEAGGRLAHPELRVMALLCYTTLNMQDNPFALLQGDVGAMDNKEQLKPPGEMGVTSSKFG